MSNANKFLDSHNRTEIIKGMERAGLYLPKKLYEVSGREGFWWMGFGKGVVTLNA